MGRPRRSPDETSRITLVLDFDGTLTLRDIGHAVCKHFLDEEARLPPIAAWMRGELSLGEAQAQIWPRVRAPEAEVLAYVAEVGTLRAGVDELLSTARERGWHVVIASGGFDFYLRHLLGERLRVDPAPELISNRGRFGASGIEVQFPHVDPSCRTCAVCKGVVLDRLRQRHPQRPLIFVGDGLTDRCAMGRADRLFAVAGGELESHCREAGAPCETFTDLGEVARALSRMSPAAAA
jgi:2,3-diketo-5-methylthio-1-phosphopentane phosphatase